MSIFFSEAKNRPARGRISGFIQKMRFLSGRAVRKARTDQDRAMAEAILASKNYTTALK